jgi:transaldolase
VERGLSLREKAKKDISRMGPVCTLMVGRLDDWLRVVAEKQNIIADPRVFDWAGVAVMKKASWSRPFASTPWRPTSS